MICDRAYGRDLPQYMIYYYILPSIAKYNEVVLCRLRSRGHITERLAPPAVKDGGLQIVITICNSA